MPVPNSTERRSTAVEFVPILVANLLPLVGVSQLGWDPSTLVTIYAAELLLSFPLAGAQALFAGRPPQSERDGTTVLSVSNDLIRKRGHITMRSWLPPLYPRNIPFAVTVVGAAGWFSIFVGIVLSGAIPVVEILGRPEIIASVAALVVGHSIETWRDYFRGGQYETVTPYAVVETPARQAFFLTFALFVMPGVDVAGAGVVLGAFVLVKILGEWSAFRASQGGNGRLTGWLAGPDADGAPEADPPTLPDSEPDARVRTDGRTVFWTGVLRTLVRLRPIYGSWSLIGWFTSLAVFGGDEVSRSLAVGSGLVIGGLVAALLGVEIGTYWLRYAPLEYRRYGDRLVAYDRILDEPQWSHPLGELRDVAVVADRLPDRLFGT
jgi:hypothetical protein